MNNFIIRIEFHHDEHHADYEKLHDVLYESKIYRVVWIPQENAWYDLPTGLYIYNDSSLSHGQIGRKIERIVEKIISEHKRYTPLTIKNQYSFVVPEIGLSPLGPLRISVHLQRTTNEKKMPR